MENKSLLLIDDDNSLTTLLNDYLALEGFNLSVASDGQSGLDLALGKEHFDLILLDVMLPELDGFELLKRLRQNYLTPVLMLTAKGDELDRILGLELGADDYLAKPFSTRELLARIKAILRRVDYTNNKVLKTSLVAGDIILNTSKQQAFFADTPLALTQTEYAILQLLVLKKGKLISKHELSEKVFGKKLAAHDRNIDVHVSNLRKKLALFSNTEFIRTVRGSGYMMVEFWLH